MTNIGLLHPGEMGVSVAASAINSGQTVYWASDGRSDKTRARAETYGLMDAGSLAELCQVCEIIMSICPPHAAESIAYAVMEYGYLGTYLDANAIAPRRSVKIGEMMRSKGIRFIDGAIIGGPAWTPKETWLYISGEDADYISTCFSSGPLETKIIGSEIGKASALKMCYAAYSKGTTALLATILAASESLGVRRNLYEHWDMDDQGFSEQVNRRVTRVTAKAWRFEAELNEIASTFRAAGLTSQFHEAAAEIYHRMADFKDRADPPSLDEIIPVLFVQ